MMQQIIFIGFQQSDIQLLSEKWYRDKRLMQFLAISVKQITGLVISCIVLSSWNFYLLYCIGTDQLQGLLFFVSCPCLLILCILLIYNMLSDPWSGCREGKYIVDTSRYEILSHIKSMYQTSGCLKLTDPHSPVTHMIMGFEHFTTQFSVL